MLKRFVDFLQSRPWDFYGLPLTIFIISAIALWFVTLALQRWTERQNERAQVAAARGDGLALGAWNRFFLSEGRLLAASILWIRWFGLVILFFYMMTMIIGNVQDALAEVADRRFASLTDLVRRIELRLTSWGKIAVNVFTLIIGAIWLTQFIENAIHVIVNRYVLAGGSTRAKLRTETLNVTSSYAVRSLMFAVLFLLVMQMVGLNIAPLLATAGVASIAIGFGAQTLVKDVLAGFFILLEDQYAVGDVISVGDKAGRVESMTLRVTRLRNGNGELVVIPNGEIRTLNNKTSGWAQVDFKVGIAYNSDVDFALGVLKDELNKLHNDFSSTVLGAPDLVGVDKLLDSSVVLRAFIKTDPDKRWDVERELNRRVLARFRAENIGIPFPQQELWIHKV